MGKEKLKIAMLGHKHIPSREGGIEVVVEELGTRLVELKQCVVCYNRKGYHVSGKQYSFKKVDNYKGIRCEEVPTINKKGLAAVSSSFFATIKATLGKYDVVHIHAEGPAFLCWLPRLCGKKVVVTIHGLDWDRAKWGRFASWYIKTGEKNAVKYANEIIVLSKNAQRYFYDKYGRTTCLIPNGVNKPNIVSPHLIFEKWGLEKDSYILYLGRLVPEKGVHYLITAYKNNKLSKKLVIAGGSSDTDGYMNELKQIGDDVIFTGFQEGKVLEELYSNAYLYCLPSDLEGMPLSLLEAMSYGNCCLVSDIPECKEVVSDYGITFKKGSIDDLGKKLIELCANPELVSSYKNRACDYICTKYNWDDVAMQTLKLYRGEKQYEQS